MGTVISNHIWKMLGPTLCLMLFPLAISCLHVTESPVTCASNNTACDLHGCEFITFFGPDGFPLRDICQLSHSCDETLSCTECISETKRCYNVCSKNIIGAVDENLLDIVPNIGTEGECRELCRDKSGCEYYTYYLETDPNYGTCFHLKSLEPPVQDCPSCVTGPKQCDGPADCSFHYEGHNHTHLMFTEPGVDITFSTSGGSYFTDTECQIRVLAVGGGGLGYHGGGGSGYIQYNTRTISGPALISVMVGDHGEASTFFMGNTGWRLRAEHGQDGGNNWGGDGYSGGAGFGTCNGGSAGSEGECGNAVGSGTGEDV